MRALVSLILLMLPHDVTSIYPQGLLMLLKQRYPDWEPNAVVDIGANIGAWSHRVRVNYPSTKILMLEATPKHSEALKLKSQELGQAEYQIALLTGTAGETVEFFQDGNTGNSMFREKSTHYANSKPVQRTTSRLDDVIQQSFLRDEPAIDFIKADVQGAELLVLEGADQTLVKASFIQLEVATVDYNAGGACFYEIDAFLRSKGFYLYEISDMQRNNPSFGTLGLGQFDVLYVNPSSPRLPPIFKELNGRYCGMNQPPLGTDHGSSLLNSRAMSILDKYGWKELEQAMEESVDTVAGKWLYRMISVIMLIAVFLAGAQYGAKRARKSLRCIQ